MRFTRLRSLILAVGVLVSVAFMASSACDAWRIYNQSIAQTQRELGNVARALAEHGAHTFRFMDLTAPALHFDHLRQFYSAMELGPTGAINVLREDGTLLFRHPPAPSHLGRVYPELTVETAASDGLVTAVDERPVYAAVAKVRDLPLMIAVTRERAAALEPWREEVSSLALRTAVGVLVVILGIAALLNQLRREQSGEAALRKSEERYALAMEGANEGHWDWDVETDRLFVSPKMKALAGLRADTPVNTRAEMLACANVHPDDLPRLHALLNEHLEGRSSLFELEYRVRHPDGEWHWLLARGRALRHEGKAYRFVGSAIDVTARKEAEAEKDRLQAQLRQSQKMEAIGTLAGGIAHDFNNILGAILGYGELAQKHTSETSPARRYLGNVMKAAGRAKTLVERILRFSRSGLAESGPVEIQAVIEETVMLVGASLPPRVRLGTRLDCGNAAVAADPIQIQQIAMNLLTNAIQAMESGGTVMLELDCVEVRDTRALVHGTLSQGEYVRLLVSDTGRGITREALDRIFDPFFTTKRVGEGTGLGLSVVHGIVADLGGAIEVWSELGVGTTFSIWLPISARLQTLTIVAAGEAPRGRGESVMIVDDERPLVALAEEMLADIGYKPTGFHSSADALQAFRRDPQRYDVVLTDETMPDLLGSDLAREIARLRPDIPIVLMSGYTGKQLADRARASGVTAVLRKPLVGREIAESLARALGTRHAHAA